MAAGTARVGGSVWRSLRSFIADLVRSIPGPMTLALALTVAVGLTEGFGLLLLVPLLDAVGLDPGQGGAGRIAEGVATVFSLIGLRPTLEWVLGGYVVVASSRALLARAQLIAAFDAEQRFEVALRKRLYASIARANWRYLSSLRSSDLTHLLTHEIQRVGAATYQLLSLASSAVIGVVYIGVAVRVSLEMTLLTFGCGGLLLLALRSRVIDARVEGEAVSGTSGRLYTAAVEHIAALKTAKSYGAERRHVDSLAGVADDLARTHVRAARLHAGSRSRFEIGSLVTLGTLVYVGLHALAMPVAAVLLLLFLFTRLMPQLSALQQGVEQLAHVLPSFDAVTRLQRSADAQAETAPPSLRPVAFRDRIRFDNVTFAYADRSAAAVQNVTCEVPLGAITAVVGESGAGKSTFADLLIALHRPQTGRLLVDGRPLDAERAVAWRHQVGYVAQDTFLFHDTIRANLLWAHPSATDDELWEALDLASAADFVRALSGGLDTIVGDRGARLSGGERQRLSLARALLRKPRLLVLDEATSALDSANEIRILDAIDRLRGTLAVVLIAHRLSTVRRADRIHVLDGGRLVESGTWEELRASGNGRFSQLCRAQGLVDAPAEPLAAGG